MKTLPLSPPGCIWRSNSSSVEDLTFTASLREAIGRCTLSFPPMGYTSVETEMCPPFVMLPRAGFSKRSKDEFNQTIDMLALPRVTDQGRGRNVSRIVTREGEEMFPTSLSTVVIPLDPIALDPIALDPIALDPYPLM
jgi:hypothetical protein